MWKWSRCASSFTYVCKKASMDRLLTTSQTVYTSGESFTTAGATTEEDFTTTEPLTFAAITTTNALTTQGPFTTEVFIPSVTTVFTTAESSYTTDYRDDSYIQLDIFLYADGKHFSFIWFPIYGLGVRALFESLFYVILPQNGTK